MEKRKKSWRSFPNLKTSDELLDYLKERPEGHKEFFHYTTLKTIDAILSNKAIRISSVCAFNDKKDREQFGEESEAKKYFALCFSTGTNENLSLWYLYSGVDGKGGRVGFTRDKLKKMISQGEFYLSEYDRDGKTCIGQKILLKDEDMRISFKDILYSRCNKGSDYKNSSSEQDKNINLKYNNQTNYGNVPFSEYEKFKEEYKGFIKSLIWYYEKETRLLIELKVDAANKINPEKDYVIIWEFPDELMRYIKITSAPEISCEDELEKYINIKKFIFKTSRVSLSENSGDIEMNICSKCDYEEKFCSKCAKNKALTGDSPK